MQKYDYILIGLIILAVLICAAAYLNYQGDSKISNSGHDPFGDPCENDTDCNCTLTCPDCCGKVGQSWKCKDNKCQLGFFGG